MVLVSYQLQLRFVLSVLSIHLSYRIDIISPRQSALYRVLYMST